MTGVKRRRSRFSCVLIVAVLVFLGLGSRSFLVPLLPTWIATYAGDTLWASMVFYLLAWCRPQAQGVHLAAAAGLFSLMIELSQLYRGAWLEALRATRLGGLILGHGFLWHDLACYAVGVGLAWALDALLARGRTGQITDCR